MSGERKYPPSQHRLKQLREIGIVPASSILSGFGAIAGSFVAVVWFVRGSSTGLVDWITARFSHRLPAGDDLDLVMKQMVTGSFDHLYFGLFCLLVGPLVGLILVNVVQVGGFLFSFKRRRRGKGVSAAWMTFGSRVIIFVSTILFCSLIALGAGLSLVSWNYWELGIIDRSVFRAEFIVSDINTMLASATGHILRFGWSLVLVFGTLFLCFGIISRIIAGFQFRTVFAMTRAEYESELRETEISPAFGQAIRERHIEE